MLSSIVSSLLGRLPVTPEALGVFFSSVWEFLFGFAMVYLFGRYLLKPVLGFLLKDRKIVVDAAIRQLVLQLVTVGSAVVGIWVGLHFAGAASVIAGTATIISAGTLAVGVASRDIISNLVNGLFLISDPQFEVGDWVEWNDREGVVEEVGIRVSRIRTFQNRTVVVPNSEIGNSALTNHSDKDRIKIVVPIGVGYDEDLAVAKKLAVDEALKIPTVMEDPMPGVSVVGLGASWVDMKVAVWIDTSDHATMYETRDDLVSRIKARFGQENISMPYKQRGLNGQIEVANIDSDKLSAEEGTKIDDPSEIDLGIDLSELERKQRESDEDISQKVTEAIQQAVDLGDENNQSTETPDTKAAERNPEANGDGSSDREELIVAKESRDGDSTQRVGTGDAPDPPDADEDENGKEDSDEDADADEDENN